MPSYLPEGRAVITVVVHDADGDDRGPLGESDPDRQDIEWWNEFEREPGDDG